jgi:intein/homing endonuclease
MGEKVVTYNEILKMNMTDTVLEAIHNDVKERIIYTINLENGKTLRPNNVHSMYEVGKDGYQTIDELYERYKNGETLYFRDIEGKKVKVTGMKSEKIVTAVYNLHVTGISILNPDSANPFIGVGHSYYANGVLSHNAIFWIDSPDYLISMQIQT